MSDLISRQQAIDTIEKHLKWTTIPDYYPGIFEAVRGWLNGLPSVQPERKTGHWILDRSGAYCCDNCMEPCATYAMMKPRDKFCKMCGSRNEVME